MAGLYSRIKLWVDGEQLDFDDLNAEFNNILANSDASHSEGYSQNLAQMQTTEDPGEISSENLTQPISTAQEIERLRFVIQRMAGTDEWYQSPAATLQTLSDALSQAFVIEPSRIISGLTSTLSSQPKFIRAEGTSGVQLSASTPAPFDVYIDGTLYTFSSNIVLTGLSSSASTGNTAILADTFTNAQQSRTIKKFNVSSPGSEFTANIGRTCIFKIFNGSLTEYFMGTIQTSTVTGQLQLLGLYRGYLFDATAVASAPVTLTTGHTITILRMTYLFLTTAGALVSSYNPLHWGGIAPGAASNGDYWFDEISSQWKVYNGTAWVQANATFVGICAQDGTNTVVSRSNELYRQFGAQNDVLLDYVTNSTVSANARSSGNVSIYGKNNHFEEYFFNFDITSNLVSGETEQVSTFYYLYLNEVGTPFITSLAPINRKDLLGFYHPSETWRCIGSVYNNASSNFDPTSLDLIDNSYLWDKLQDNNDIDTTINPVTTPLTTAAGTYNQVAVTFTLPVANYALKNKELTIRKIDSSTNTLIITDGASFQLYIGSQNGSFKIKCDGVVWYVLESHIGTVTDFWLNTIAGFGSTNTAVFRFANNPRAIGGDIQLVQSGTLGDSFSVLCPGLYSVQTNWTTVGGATAYTIQKNNTGVDTANALGIANPNSSNSQFASAGGTFNLARGDIIRTVVVASTSSADPGQVFRITRVA